jgi:uncharacterized spore protein YtfJ
MTLGDTLRTMLDSAAARTVFGEPVTRDGVTVIPVARVVGAGGLGGGGGTRSGPDVGEPEAGEVATHGSGSGGGFTLAARPVGVFVVRDGDAHWRPALDLNRIVLGAQVVGIVALLTARTLIRRRRRRA